MLNDVTHWRRILSFASSALLLLACARDHGPAGSQSAPPPHASDGAAGVVGGKAGSMSQPKPEKTRGPGTKAVAVLEPPDDSTQDSGSPLHGTATFSVSESGVDLSILAQNCPASASMRFFIQAGGDCSSETLAGPHWDGARGEGILSVACLGVSGQGRGALTRSNEDTLPWTIGGSSDTNLLGHALVAYDSASDEPVACGVIMLDEASSAAPVADAGVASSVPLLGRAQVAGLCLGGMLVRDNTQQCPDPEALSACAQEHCQLDSCIATCANYLACTTQAADPCSVAFTCSIDLACMTCQNAVQMCSFSFCADQLACAAPVSPDGPCSQLTACCNLQGDKADSCLQIVHQLEQLSGDPSCLGVMSDWDVVAHLPVPCMFE